MSAAQILTLARITVRLVPVKVDTFWHARVGLRPQCGPAPYECYQYLLLQMQCMQGAMASEYDTASSYATCENRACMDILQ